jgi:hypothetical protein
MYIYVFFFHQGFSYKNPQQNVYDVNITIYKDKYMPQPSWVFFPGIPGCATFKN